GLVVRRRDAQRLAPGTHHGVLHLLLALPAIADAAGAADALRAVVRGGATAAPRGGRRMRAAGSRGPPGEGLAWKETGAGLGAASAAAARATGAAAEAAAVEK